MAVIKSEYLLSNYDPEEVGMKGEKGDDGKTSYVHIAYSNSSDGGVDFSTTDATNRAYTGYYTDFEMIDSTDPSKYEWQRTKGDSGKDGVAGKDGVGLKSTTITYASHTNASTPPSTGWKAEVPTVPAGQYLWTKTVWTYTDTSSETGYSVARIGQDGAKGNEGIAGKDGVGIKTTLIEYAVNTSGTVRPTSGWSTTIPVTPEGQYLWTRTTWTYTDNTTEQGYSVARQGNNGQNGTNGADGDDGVGISTTIIEYNKSTNSTTPPSTGWTSTIPSISGGQYLWTRVTLNYTNGQKAESYTVARQGEDGADGQLFTGETEPTDFNEGDIWYKVVSGKVTGVYEAKGGAWAEIPFESSVIAETIIGKTITGGKINGSTINGSEFNNAFNNVVAGVNVVSDGKTSISNGALSEVASYYLVNTAGERLYLFADNEAYLTRGSLEVRQKLYNEEGTKTSESSGQLSGGLLQLNLSDSTGTYNGVLDAKLLESMSGIKQRIITIPNTKNYANGRIEYRRFGQIVTAAIKFDRLTANGWVTLSNIPNGYRPYSYLDSSTYLTSTGNRGSFVSLYTDPSFNFIYIPSVPGGSTSTESYQGSVTYFTNQAWGLA
ncbi:virion structural protein [Enterococcus phage IME-EFm1]|uniref:Tail assembly protein n=1 Tax=Enterococcus phage IME-EFm1 TaxID=1445858 RepID=A0A060AN56_9CAUD|nr:virion structural protein [Enterococcus phage IME-EFm1]AIA65087.1 tail assembly protein [Enterococcus phage IME-EFm1]